MQTDRIAEMRVMACNQGHPLRDKLIEGEVHALLDCAEALERIREELSGLGIVTEDTQERIDVVLAALNGGSHAG